jgi:hypothetical protein
MCPVSAQRRMAGSGMDALASRSFGGLSGLTRSSRLTGRGPWATDSWAPCQESASRPAAFAFAGGAFLGARAGDVAFAAQSSSGIAIAAPPFRPVWALAARTGGRPLPATALPFRAPPQMPYGPPVAREQIVQWCNLLRGSAAPTEANTRELWRLYRQLARRLRRRRR